MKLQLCLIFSLLSATPVFASKLVDNLKAGKDQTVVVYGTSLTAGGKWVSSTQEWLASINPDAKVNIINGGQSGQNSLVGLAKLDSVVIAKKPDTVLIEFAVNDAFLYPEEQKRVSAEQSGKNLESMIKKIRKVLPDTEIIIQTMNPAWDSPKGNGSASKRPDLAACYESYRKIAAKHGLLLIDHHKNWEKIRAEDEDLFRTYVMDGIHPTAEASVKVTFPEVKKMLEK